MRFNLIAVACQMAAITAVAQNPVGSWQLENAAKDMGDGIEMHLSGNCDFDNNGAVQVEYKIITTMAGPATDGSEAKSVYLELLIDGTGCYSITDGSLNINLDTLNKSYSMGEGTYDNMGPALVDADGAQLAGIWFSAMADVLADGFRNVDIKDVTLSDKKIDGTLMDTRVTLTRID